MKGGTVLLREMADHGARNGCEDTGEGTPVYIQLTNMYAPAWGYGGPVRLMFAYAQWMSNHSQVVALTGDVDHDLNRMPLKFEVMQGIPIYRCDVFFPGLFKRSIYLLSPTMCARAAQRIWHWNGPAIVHFSEFRGLIPLYALLLKVIFRKRVILVHSAFGSLYHKASIRRKVYDILIMKAFTRLVDIRLVQNEHERETYQRICDQYATSSNPQIFLLPLHVDGIDLDDPRFTESGKNPAMVRDARQTYGVPKGALIFLFLGRLHPAKGIIRMIDAFVEFSRSSSRETLLLVVGRDDGFQAKTEECIRQKGLRNKIRIVNNVYENRFDYYFLADVFLGFPTIFEETMLASIEAMSCGTPIVVSREADIPFVAEEQAGYVIDFDVQSAVVAMTRLVDNPHLYEVNARRTAARFGGTNVAPKLMELFRSAVNGELNSIDRGKSSIDPYPVEPA
jgi:glycosyltransferase involved in cell wall biosynthesis